MKLRTFILSVAMLSLPGGFVAAFDDVDDETARKLAQIVELGPGVHKIKKDAKGNIVSCVVVGQSRISTVLGKAKGLQTARTRARLAAVAEFRKWLKEKVRVYEKSSDQSIVLLEGREDGKNDEVRESGKAVESTSTRYESIAVGLVRGMQVIHSDVSDEDKTYTLVLGWDASTAEATKKVDANLKSDRTTSGKSGKKVDKKIKSKKATSGDAKKFID